MGSTPDAEREASNEAREMVRNAQFRTIMGVSNIEAG
jgi:hypothetical protein